MISKLLKLFWKKIYVVEAVSIYSYDSGYTVSVFSKKKSAIECADDHVPFRGGKYSCTVCVQYLNHCDHYVEYEEIYNTTKIKITT